MQWKEESLVGGTGGAAKELGKDIDTKTSLVTFIICLRFKEKSSLAEAILQT